MSSARTFDWSQQASKGHLFTSWQRVNILLRVPSSRKSEPWNERHLVSKQLASWMPGGRTFDRPDPVRERRFINAGAGLMRGRSGFSQLHSVLRVYGVKSLKDPKMHRKPCYQHRSSSIHISMSYMFYAEFSSCHNLLYFSRLGTGRTLFYAFSGCIYHLFF